MNKLYYQLLIYLAFRRYCDCTFDVEIDSSSTQCLGDLAALLASEVVALKDRPGSGDELVDIFAGERDGVASITIVEPGGFLNGIVSPLVSIVGTDSNRAGRLVVRHGREHDPLFLVFSVHSSRDSL